MRCFDSALFPAVIAWLGATWTGLTAAAQSSNPASLEFFERNIRPVLVEHCYACHSAEAAARGKLRGELMLDSREGIQRGGESGPAVVPHDVAASLLISALRHESFDMPPKGKLPEATIEAFVKWVQAGAVDPREQGAIVSRRVIDLEEGRKFWSFQPLKVSSPPVDQSGWSKTPIDRFITAAHQLAGVPGSRAAAPRTLIRRAWLDLLGLPPSAEDVDAWTARLAISTPKTSSGIDDAAWADLIDHLLESPRYGERWARHWMDVARFAESHGYEQDYARPSAFHYRDFLIRAFNQDLPYDRFVRWQIAGDELEPEDPLAWMATGFLAAGPFPTQLTEEEFESARYDELDDMAATTGVAFLGLSLGCARCHDHKFDPIRASDYYRFVSIFTSAVRSEKAVRLPETAPDVEPVNVLVSAEGLPPLKHHADARGFPHFYPQTFHLRRGDVHQKGEVAQPGFPEVLVRAHHPPEEWFNAPPAESVTSWRRAGLARWLTDVDRGAGALTARVMVNRIWLHHFGRGLVATPNDFGASGERPDHPELLEWLAHQFVYGGWSIKHLHRQVMTSQVYMQSSESADGRHAEADPSLFARWVPRRLEGEAIRDSVLAVSGLLDDSLFGPGTLDPEMRRRSIYYTIKRSELIPELMLFDWPEHLVSIGMRPTTTTGPQALMFLNGALVRGASEHLARQVEPLSNSEAVIRLFRKVLGREPAPAEFAAAVVFLDGQIREYGTSHSDPRPMALTDLSQSVLSLSEFIVLP